MCQERSGLHFRLIQFCFLGLFITGCGLFSNPDKRLLLSPFGNEPNELERQYFNLAGALASEKPCFLISHDSYIVAPGTAPFNTSENVVQLHRSRCFYNAAQQSVRPELCDYVRTGSTWIYSGTDLNAAKCREDVAARKRVSGNIIETIEIVDKAGLSDSELNDAMLSLGIFPDIRVIQAYRNERETQYMRCANRYVIYSEMFFNKIDELENFAGEFVREQMENVEWQEHPFISQPGFTHCFLADGASHWSDQGVGAYSERESSGFQIPGQR